MSPNAAPGHNAIERVVPSTEGQRDIWLVDHISAEASLSYCLSLKIEVRGELDTGAAARAVQRLYERRDALRVTFSDNGEEMRFHHPGRAPFEMFDFTGLPQAERDLALHERFQLSVERAFDLCRGPVFRAELIAVAPELHFLILRTHHIVCDGWSLGVLMAEFARIYAIERDGTGGLLPAAPSFADFALEQPKAVKSMRAENEAFWKVKFDSPPAPLELPTVKPRPPVRSFASARMDYVFDRGVIERVTETARRHGHTRFSVIFAALNLVLSRICGTTDVVIGVPTAAQARTGPADLVGYAISFLPVRSRIDPAASFLSLVETTRAEFRAAIKHRMSFAAMIGLLRMRHDPSRLPLVNALLTSLPLSTVRVEGAPPLEMSAEHVARPYENFEILANVFLSDGDARVECQYNTTLFDEASVRGWFAALEAVLDGAAADFSIACDEISMLSAENRARLERWNDTAMAVDSTTLVHSLVEASVREHPQHVAASFAGRQLTYAELDAAANRLARALRVEGAQRGAMIGLLLDRGLDMIVAQLAALKTGAAYVPLDPAYPPERLSYMLEQCSVSLAIVHGETRGLMASIGAVRTVDVDERAAAIAAQSPEPLPADPLAATPNDPAYVVYTSGSTGRPKGVAAPHRAVVSFLQAMLREPGIGAFDRVLATTSLSFDPAVLEIFGSLIAGAQIIVASRDDAHDAYALRALLETSGATLMQSTPSAWRMLIDAGWHGRRGFRVLTGSEPLRPDLAADLLDRAQEVWNLYGPTETTVWATAWKVRAPERGIAIGCPIANTQVWVLDDQQRLCPVDVPGEIYIGGAGVALGYIRRADLTEERFIPNPFRPGERMYRTGDRGRWRDDGVLEFLGRVDFQLKVRGHRIEPGEVEAALVTHPQVGTAVVVARELEPGDTRLVAYVVCKEPFPDATALREHVRRELPEYMVPQLFVRLDTMPRLPNGKIDRNGLPAPTDDSAGRCRNFTEPRTAAEIAVADVWRRLLGVERIGIADNFFDLGGHSLLAMSAIADIEKTLGVRLSARQMVFETLEQVARAAAPKPGAAPQEAPRNGGWLSRLFGPRKA